MKKVLLGAIALTIAIIIYLIVRVAKSGNHDQPTSSPTHKPTYKPTIYPTHKPIDPVIFVTPGYENYDLTDFYKYPSTPVVQMMPSDVYLTFIEYNSEYQLCVSWKDGDKDRNSIPTNYIWSRSDSKNYWSIILALPGPRYMIRNIASCIGPNNTHIIHVLYLDVIEPFTIAVRDTKPYTYKVLRSTDSGKTFKENTTVGSSKIDSFTTNFSNIQDNLIYILKYDNKTNTHVDLYTYDLVTDILSNVPQTFKLAPTKHGYLLTNQHISGFHFHTGTLVVNYIAGFAGLILCVVLYSFDNSDLICDPENDTTAFTYINDITAYPDNSLSELSPDGNTIFYYSDDYYFTCILKGNPTRITQCPINQPICSPNNPIYFGSIVCVFSEDKIKKTIYINLLHADKLPVSYPIEIPGYTVIYNFNYRLYYNKKGDGLGINTDWQTHYIDASQVTPKPSPYATITSENLSSFMKEHNATLYFDRQGSQNMYILKNESTTFASNTSVNLDNDTTNKFVTFETFKPLSGIDKTTLPIYFFLSKNQRCILIVNADDTVVLITNVGNSLEYDLWAFSDCVDPSRTEICKHFNDAKGQYIKYCDVLNDYYAGENKGIFPQNYLSTDPRCIIFDNKDMMKPYAGKFDEATESKITSIAPCIDLNVSKMRAGDLEGEASAPITYADNLCRDTTITICGVTINAKDGGEVNTKKINTIQNCGSGPGPRPGPGPGPNTPNPTTKPSDIHPSNFKKGIIIAAIIVGVLVLITITYYIIRVLKAR